MNRIEKNCSDINVKEIMSEIREQIRQEERMSLSNVAGAQGGLFNRELDVAEVMRNITTQVIQREVIGAVSDSNSDIHEQLEGIACEIARIHEYTEGTRKEAFQHMEPGCIIPVNTSRPVIIQKILTICKRLVRKATRFLVLDQMVFNTKVNDCIRALRESQEQTVKLVKLVDQLSSEESRLQDEVELYSQEMNQRLVEVDRKAQKEIIKLIEVIGELGQKNIQLQERLTASSQANNERINILETYSQINDERMRILNDQSAEFEQKIQNIGQHLEQADVVIQEMKRKISDGEEYGASVISDELYVQFENEFRGSEEEIKHRLRFYVENYVKKTIRNKATEKILDLGCGRGEWLELLRQDGYMVKGIDFNLEMVSVCTAKGLEAETDDAVEYLRKLPDNSVKMITGFQIAEHIPLKKLSELVKESYRVLNYHGMLILETPNCKNLEIGAANFYHDPTHKRPLHPEYMRFLAKTSGFYETDLAMWKQGEVQGWLDSVIANDSTDVMNSPVVRTMLESMKATIYNSPDYALIAIK